MIRWLKRLVAGRELAELEYLRIEIHRVADGLKLQAPAFDPERDAETMPPLYMYGVTGEEEA
jgi:hypothetical protein